MPRTTITYRGHLEESQSQSRDFGDNDLLTHLTPSTHCDLEAPSTTVSDGPRVTQAKDLPPVYDKSVKVNQDCI